MARIKNQLRLLAITAAPMAFLLIEAAGRRTP